MKSRRLLAFSPLLAATLLAQTFPAVDFVSVSANATTGQLLAPTNFFSNATNATAMANAVANGTATAAGRGLLTISATTPATLPGNLNLSATNTEITTGTGGVVIRRSDNSSTVTELKTTAVGGTATLRLNSTVYGAHDLVATTSSGAPALNIVNGSTTVATFTPTAATFTGNSAFSATGNATSPTNGPHRFGSNVALSGTSGGPSFFGGSVVTTSQANLSLPNNTPTTIATHATSTVVIYSVSLNVNGNAGFAIVGQGPSASPQILMQGGSQMTFSVSGQNIQLTQTSGAASSTNTITSLRLL